MTRVLVTVGQIAEEYRIPEGRAIYLLQQAGAPLPAERKRKRRYDHAEVALYLRSGGFAQC